MVLSSRVLWPYALQAGEDNSRFGLWLKTLRMRLCFSLLEGFYRVNGEEVVQVRIREVDVGVEI